MLHSQRTFINDLIDSNQVMQSTWQTGLGNSVSDFLHKKIASREHKIFRKSQTEIIKVKWFQTEHYSIHTLITNQ